MPSMEYANITLVVETGVLKRDVELSISTYGSNA